jgi:hypothetical protein
MALRGGGLLLRRSPLGQAVRQVSSLRPAAGLVADLALPASAAAFLRLDPSFFSTPRCPEAHCPTTPNQLPFIMPENNFELDILLEEQPPKTSFELPTARRQDDDAQAPVDGTSTVSLECLRWGRKHGKYQGLEEKWWLEHDPPKGFFPSMYGRGPHGGASIIKQDWPRQMLPIKYKKNWMNRERLRYAFRKNGFEYDIPKWGG